MIEKLKTIEQFDCSDTQQAHVAHHVYHNESIAKINELVDAVNELGKDVCFLRRKVLETTYKEPDLYKSMTYMSDGHTTKFYGHDSIVELECPLPQGTRITIKSITKGGDNE